MYIFGGRSDLGQEMFTGNSIYFNDLYVFNFGTKTWEQIHPDNQPTNNDDDYASDEDEKLKKSNPVYPSGRRSHSMLAYKNRLIMFGGFQENLKKHFNDLFEFDCDKLEWKQLNPFGLVPCPRRRHACSIIDDRMFIFGGTGPKHTSPRPAATNLLGSLNNYIENIEPVLQLFAINLNRQINNDALNVNENQNNNLVNLFRNINNILADIGRQVRVPPPLQPETENQNVNNQERVNQQQQQQRRDNSNNNDEQEVVDEVPVVEDENLNDEFMDENESLLSDSGSQDLIDEEETEEDDEMNQDLISFSDLHILDLTIPSLRNLCLRTVLINKLDYKNLPVSLM